MSLRDECLAAPLRSVYSKTKQKPILATWLAETRPAIYIGDSSARLKLNSLIYILVQCIDRSPYNLGKL